MRRGVVILISLLALIGLLWIYFERVRNSTPVEITSSDHAILKELNEEGAISSNHEMFRGVDEVCIANEIDLTRPGKLTCETEGEVIALIRGNSCEIISLEKLRKRILLSENTYECRKTNDSFRIVSHKRPDDTEVLDFD
jgi:hypothetical protein